MMEIIEKAASAAKNLIPPKDGATDVHVRRWRLWIAGATFLNAAGLSIHIALACGFASPFYSGFAQASDMQALKDDQAKRRVTELMGQMLDAKQKQCSASGDAARLYLITYNSLRAEYADLVKREFPDPPCSEFR
jgi:hypothetical protein